MKILRFIQHHKMEYPFDNWINETYEQAVKLSRGEITPSISNDIYDKLEKLENRKRFEGISVILTSPAKRAYQTAEAIQTTLHPNVIIIEMDELKETTWDLSEFILKESFETAKQEGRYSIGNKRIESFLNGTGHTTLNNAWKRLKEFETKVKTLPNKEILIVSHSFTMKLLYAYFVKDIKNKTDIDTSAIKDTYRVKYLHGFDVKL